MGHHEIPVLQAVKDTIQAEHDHLETTDWFASTTTTTVYLPGGESRETLTTRHPEGATTLTTTYRALNRSITSTHQTTLTPTSGGGLLIERMVNGEIHCDTGPAFEHYDSKGARIGYVFFQHDKVHATWPQPAVLTSEYLAFYQDDQIHNTKGPAVIFSAETSGDAVEEFHIKGLQMPRETYLAHTS